jgi:hypothetical protein
MLSAASGVAVDSRNRGFISRSVKRVNRKTLPVGVNPVTILAQANAYRRPDAESSKVRRFSVELGLLGLNL